jgi:hypothetical protein
MCCPSGERRGSTTGVGVLSSAAVPVRRSVVKSRPDSVKTACSTAVSVAYPTMPADPSRLRSRRARSSGDSSSEAPSRRPRGSAAAYSRGPCGPDGSRTQSRLDRSVPSRERRKTTREPSGATVNARGAPRVNRWVRAYWRGKEVDMWQSVSPCPARGVVAGFGICAPPLHPCTGPMSPDG